MDLYVVKSIRRLIKSLTSARTFITSLKSIDFGIFSVLVMDEILVPVNSQLLEWIYQLTHNVYKGVSFKFLAGRNKM